MTKKVIGKNASTQADAVAAIKAAATKQAAAPDPKDAVAMIKAAAAQQAQEFGEAPPIANISVNSE